MERPRPTLIEVSKVSPQEAASIELFKAWAQSLTRIPGGPKRVNFATVDRYLIRHANLTGIVEAEEDYSPIKTVKGEPALPPDIRLALFRADQTELGTHHDKKIIIEELEDLLEYNGYRYDTDTRMLELPNGEHVHLTKIEGNLFRLLIKYAERLIPYRAIAQNVWPDVPQNETDVYRRVYIRYLRQKIKDDAREPGSRHIRNTQGAGYRLTTRPDTFALTVGRAQASASVESITEKIERGDSVTPDINHVVNFNQKIVEAYKQAKLDEDSNTLLLSNGHMVKLTPGQAAVFKAVINSQNGQLDGRALAQQVWPNKNTLYPVFYEGALKAYLGRVDKIIRQAILLHS